ncbi:Site-specific recombinase XerD [Singulisphaera sp. GP187]|uniref:tyrosine-type recombinase/integrase n=1 Tax=Singulisphaera sp. GP187 TaxID=1882752 RepID=UPI00092A07D5|nr:tyrosine-type recombinase/integrase [Singulisphaera sp. GP187]SIO67940.1 Site-specific recombinase XerD [Singulisphaera sp. GP187]
MDASTRKQPITDLVNRQSHSALLLGMVPFPVRQAGEPAARRFVEFFTANIRNPNTRQAYARAVSHFFAWCEARSIALHEVEPMLVAAYIEQHPGSAPSKKQGLAAIRMLFDWLVVGQVLPMNPASSVRGPKHVTKRGKTSVLEADQARQLLDSFDTRSIAGLRDRALIGVMVYSFARVSAVVGMNVGDYFQNGKRWWFRFHEKGGKVHEVPAHTKAQEYLDAYLTAAKIGDQTHTPLFRAITRHRTIGSTRPHRTDVLQMIKRRVKAAGLPASTCCHTFRATGITVFLQNGGTVEKAQQIAGHESPRTTKLYDRTNEAITIGEVDRIII